MSEQETLYPLLPAIYRLRDAEGGEPLRALLAIIEQEYQAVRADMDGLYADWFIETCADWVIPYIGDLVGNISLHEIEQLRRSDVAKTIYYRRRKGTLATLEEMARDVTGWGAHAVEFFQLLGWTQNLNHQRLTMAPNPHGRLPNAVDRVGTVHLRHGDVADRIDTPFDVTGHTVDVRAIRHGEGWHNIDNVGFFLWRLRHFPLDGVRARRGSGITHGYHFSPLGQAAPLFNNPQREASAAGLAGEIHVPGPIRAADFYRDLTAYAAANGSLAAADRATSSDYYGPQRSLHIIKNGTAVPPLDIICKNLATWDRPPAGKVAVDVKLGRITFAAGEEPARLRVLATTGFSADMGGGPYDRRASLARAGSTTLQIDVAKGTPVNTLQKALQAWTALGQPDCLINILDNGVYGGNLDITLPADGLLVVAAANGKRPDLRLVGTSSLTAPTGGARLVLDGLLVQGGFELNGPLDFALQHCTLVPGRRLNEDGSPRFPDRDSLVVNGASSELQVTIEHSIVGPLRLPALSRSLTIRDSIVQAPQVGGVDRPAIAANDAGDEPGPVTTLERVTLWGSVYVKALTLATEVLFNQPIRAQRQQEGCIRFSYVPRGSRTPRRYRCQPDQALRQRAEALGVTVDLLPAVERSLVLTRLRPEYTSERFGDAAYGQLSLNCAAELTTGAENGAEMGAFNHLLQPQRLANLQQRLAEYLPFGLQAGFIFVT